MSALNAQKDTLAAPLAKNKSYFNKKLFVEGKHGNCNYVDFRNTDKGIPKEAKPFRVSIPMQKGFDNAPNRVLFVVDHVASSDIRNRRLFSTDFNLLFSNIIDLSLHYAQKYKGDIIEKADWKYAAINFNTHKTYHLKDADRGEYYKMFAARVLDFADKAEVTHVVILGDNAAKYLLPKTEHIQFKRGWVHKIKVGDKRLPAVTTVNISELELGGTGFEDEEKDEELEKKVGIFGYAARNISNIYYNAWRKHFWTGDIAPNPILITSLKRFDKLMDKLDEAKRIAVDSETESLNRIRNKILTVQFAVSSSAGYIVPVDHKDSPFNEEQKKYIKKRLRRFFMTSKEKCKGRYLLGQNFKFDIGQFEQQLGIPYMYWEFWDAMAGEFLLDENLRDVSKHSQIGRKGHYGLDAIFCHYGNAFYMDAAFGKNERATISESKLSNVDVQNYCSMDVQCLFGIHDAQQRRAMYETFGKYNYSWYYKNMALKQQANNIYMFSHMEQTGVPADVSWLLKLKSKAGPIHKVLTEAREKFHKLKSVRIANKRLVKASGAPAGGLFGNNSSWLFDVAKPSSKLTLFFKVLKLEPISLGKSVDKETGEFNGKVDKWFQLKYKDVPEIQFLDRISKLSKLDNTYVGPFLKRLANDPEAREGKRIRSTYGYLEVITGRSNCKYPNRQQTPSRYAEAKLIKRIFVAPEGRIILKIDFSAHEVRLWSWVSFDKALAALFQVGRDMRRKLFQSCTTWEYSKVDTWLKDLKVLGDIHVQNVKFFFNKDVDNKHPLRDAIKSVVFGVIYGKGAKALAKDINKTKEYAQNIIKKLFGRFPDAATWLEYMREFSKKHLYSYSPLGRKRNLYGYLVGDDGVTAAMERRADNAPIQGLGADSAHTSGRLFLQNMYDFCKKLKRMEYKDKRLPVAVQTMVHDSIFSEVEFRMLFIAMHILHHSATHGVLDYYKQHFDMTVTVPPEIEIEIGFDESRLYKWNWTAQGLFYVIEKALGDVNDIYPKANVDEIREKIYKDIFNPKLRKMLEEDYPIFDGASYKAIDFEQARKHAIKQIKHEKEKELA